MLVCQERGVPDKTSRSCIFYTDLNLFYNIHYPFWNPICVGWEYCNWGMGLLPSTIVIAIRVRVHHNTLHWRHNDHDGVLNHQPHGCLLDRLFRRKSKEASKTRVTGLCAGKSPGPVNSPHKGPVTRKMFPFDNVIMTIKSPSIPCHRRFEGSWNEVQVGRLHGRNCHGTDNIQK